MRVVSENEFAERIRQALEGVDADCVTGPGRSGAVAAVYASHILGIPYIPMGSPKPPGLDRLLLIDTAEETGRTMKKARRKYPSPVIMLTIYKEPPRVCFWYEAQKPQKYIRKLNRSLS